MKDLKDKNDEIGTVEYVSMLYDFYGDLLSDGRREVMALYHEDNLSLSEIAEELGMTRQAVHYSLKKAEKALQGYEDKLGLLEEYERKQKLAEKALNILEKSGASESEGRELTDIIRKLAE
ncbi:MAG: MarR family transcriptional regulator [Mogibacterium sp.]|nr:MarR family transcriptional regulator [Mogibacterium sp.]